MKTHNSHYYISYTFLLNLFLVMLFCFFLVCCARNDAKQVYQADGGKPAAANAVDINSATLAELEKLPLIGAKSAEKIIEHREKYGKFRRAEHILLIQGMSDEKYRQLKNMIKAE